MRKRRTLLLTLLALLLLVGIPTVLTVRAVHQEKLNHDLIEAIGHDDPEGVRIVLARGADPNSQDSVYTNLTVRQTFWHLLHGFNPHGEDRKRTAFLLAAGAAEHTLQQVTLADGSSVYRTWIGGDLVCPETDTQTPAIVQALVNKGANLNAKGQLGRTALIQAAQVGYIHTASILLEKGASVNLRDDEGETALDHALWSENQEMIQRLRLAGAKTAKELDAQAATSLKR